MKLAASLLLGLIVISTAQAGSLVDKRVEEIVIEEIKRGDEVSIVDKEEVTPVITEEAGQVVPLNQNSEESPLDFPAFLHKVLEEIQRFIKELECQEKAIKEVTATVSQAFATWLNYSNPENIFNDLTKIYNDVVVLGLDAQKDLNQIIVVWNKCSGLSCFSDIFKVLEGLWTSERPNIRKLFDDLMATYHDIE